MADKPIILALANPNPEILPEAAKAVRPDCIIATGRSDYPNQVNNALCFPYIFRGALDVGATEINEAMKLACVHAIAELARMESSDLGSAYGGEVPVFGPDYLIPRPFDPRLLVVLAPCVAQAAMDSGVALRPIADMAAYSEKLGQFVYRTGLVMKPVYERARSDKQRVVYAEGEEETVLRAVQTVIDEELAHPILIGRPDVIETRIERLGLRMRPGVDFELTNINDDPRFNDYWQQYHALTERRGVTPAAAKNLMRSRPTLIAALMVERGEADALICGLVGRFHKKLGYLRSVFGLDPGVQCTSAMTGVINDRGAWFFLDTHVQLDPTAEQIADSTLQATYRLKLFGIEPKVALLSHSNFGSHDNASAREDAQGARDPQIARAQARGRRRDAGRHRLGRAAAPAHVSEHHAQRPRQPVRDAEPRCRQHHLQHGAGDDRRRCDRPDPDGHRPARTRADAGLDAAARGQHDRAGGGRCADSQGVARGEVASD